MLSEAETAREVASRPLVSTALWRGPLFIVGMPRSGTKLLRGLLGQHPRIRIPDTETEFLPFLVEWVRQHGEPRSEQAFAALYQRLSRAPYFTLRRAAHAFSPHSWREQCDRRFGVAGLFEGFIRYETEVTRDSQLIWGDKSPSYIRHMGLLLEHFPQARIVHIVRDVRDYSASIRHAWNKDIRRAAFQWGEDVARAHDLCMAEQRRCIEVRYEDLLQAPEMQMRRLSQFLDVEFCEAMTRLARPAENLGDATGRSEIVRDNFQKFQSRLKRDEIESVEALSFNTMQWLGYHPLYARGQRKLGPLSLGCLKLKDGANLVMRQARKRGLMKAVRFHASHSSMIRGQQA